MPNDPDAISVPQCSHFNVRNGKDSLIDRVGVLLPDIGMRLRKRFYAFICNERLLTAWDPAVDFSKSWMPEASF
jgi:hypothetical protein